MVRLFFARCGPFYRNSARRAFPISPASRECVRRTGGCNFRSVSKSMAVLSDAAFPPSVKPHLTRSLTRICSPKSDAERLRPRSPHADSRHSQQLRGEDNHQLARGWLQAPSRLDSNGQFGANPTEPANCTFRFGVLHRVKLRGCVDFRDSLTNTSRTALTPIAHPV